MSGIEVIGLISAIIGIIDGMSKLFKAIENSRDLPDVFNAVSQRLPLIRTILQAAERHISQSTEDQGDIGATQTLLESCRGQALQLNSILQAVTAQPGATFADRSLLVARRLSKGSKIEGIMKSLLENVQLLGTMQIMKRTTNAKVPNTTRAIANPTPLLLTVSHYGLGRQFSNMRSGQQHINMGKGQQVVAQSVIIQRGSQR